MRRWRALASAKPFPKIAQNQFAPMKISDNLAAEFD
jgi:hypothetical protein